MELRFGQIANTGLVFLDDIHDLDGQIGGEKRPISDDVHAVPEGVAVMQDFLGVRRKIGAVSVGGETAIEFVVSGENILDLGTEFRFLESESIQQDSGIRDAVGAAL